MKLFTIIKLAFVAIMIALLCVGTVLQNKEKSNPKLEIYQEPLVIMINNIQR